MPKMTAEEAVKQGKGLNFEKVWTVMMETNRRMAEFAAQTAELSKETDRKMAEAAAQAAEQFKETDQRMAELVAQSKEIGQKRTMTDEELRNREKKADRMRGNGGGLNRSLGELIETFVVARLWERFPPYGLERACQRIPIYDKPRRVRTDVDILLVNTDICMAVEVKRDLNRKDDVDDHVKRMGLIRRYPPEQVSGKRLLGAMAGGVVDPDVKDYAYKRGFFVLELSGEVVRLIPPPEGFDPQNW
jgi:hypothetical protein